MINNVHKWCSEIKNQQLNTLFNETSANSGHVSFGIRNKYAHFGYDRLVLHISAFHCNHTSHFKRAQVFCTDGETIGHHLPGECPFKVKP